MAYEWLKTSQFAHTIRRRDAAVKLYRANNDFRAFAPGTALHIQIQFSTQIEEKEAERIHEMRRKEKKRWKMQAEAEAVVGSKCKYKTHRNTASCNRGDNWWR